MTRDDVLTLIRAHLADELELDPARIVETTHFREDLSADSLDLYSLVQELEDTYGIKMPEEDAARRRSGSPSRSATRRHDRPLTVCARILVSRPAPWDSAASRGYRCVVTARPSTESPRNASRS